MVTGWWAISDLNGGPSGCKPDALTAELTALENIVAEPARLRLAVKRFRASRIDDSAATTQGSESDAMKSALNSSDHYS